MAQNYWLTQAQDYQEKSNWTYATIADVEVDVVFTQLSSSTNNHLLHILDIAIIVLSLSLILFLIQNEDLNPGYISIENIKSYQFNYNL